jgi:hypothetical protein
VTHQAETDQVSDYALGLIRTVVPTLWGALAAWGVAAGVHLPAAADVYGPAILAFLLASVWYAVWHAVERKLPPWATRLVLGANTEPRYASTPDRPAPEILKPTATAGPGETAG